MKRYEVIRDLILQEGLKKIAEIGVDSGETSKFLLSACPLERYLLVDPCLNINDFSSYDQSIIEMHPRKSAEVVKNIKDGSLDLVFIDGDHSYDAVKHDIMEWGKKVRNGGLLCGHDYSHTHEGVIRAVDELIGKKNFVQREDCCMWICRVEKDGVFVCL